LPLSRSKVPLSPNSVVTEFRQMARCSWQD
jgi:hypothetical protein